MALTNLGYKSFRTVTVLWSKLDASQGTFA